MNRHLGKKILPAKRAPIAKIADYSNLNDEAMD